MPGLRIQEARGNPVGSGSQQITPIARVIRLTWRGGGVEWRWPMAVETRQGESVRRLPIGDATRRAIAGVIFAELVLGALALWAQRVSLRRRISR